METGDLSATPCTFACFFFFKCFDCDFMIFVIFVILCVVFCFSHDLYPFSQVGAKQKLAQVISPTACGALFSARTTQPSQNPRGTLVEFWWNPGCPGPPRSLSGLRPQSFQLLGKQNKKLLGVPFGRGSMVPFWGR